MTLSSASGIADLLAAPTEADRLAHLRSEGLANESGLSWVLDRADELVHDDPAAARELAELCDTAGALLELPTTCARARYLRARIHAERGELSHALDLIEQARAGWWQAGQYAAALRTDLGRMKVLDDLGRHVDAATVGEALLTTLAQLPPDPGEERLRRWLAAAAQENVGVAHSFTGQHERALVAYAGAESAYRALDMAADTARLLANRGVELLEWGRPREALEVLRRAEAEFTALGDRLWSAKCLGDIAKADQQLGRYIEALRLLGSARTTLDDIGAAAEAARLRLATAGVYLAVGLFTEAKVEAAAAAELTAASGMLHDAALARFTVALAQLGAGELDGADVELRAAAALFEQVGDRQYQARVRLATVDVFVAQGWRCLAADAAAGSAEVFSAGGWLVPLAMARLRQADLAKDDPTAERYLDLAAELAERLGLPQLRYPYALRLARLRRRQGRSADAETVLRTATVEVELLGGSLPDHALRTAFRADRLAAHDELVDLLITRGEPADIREARSISDRVKAATLIDLVDGAVGRRHHDRDHPQWTQLDQMRMDLDAAYGALLTVTEPGRRARLRQRVDELEQQLSTLQLRLAVTGNPARHTAARTAVEDRATPTLAYHVVGDDVIAFFSTGGVEVKARRLPGVMSTIDLELDRLAAQWTRFRLGSTFGRRHHDALLATTTQTLRTLYQLLMAPVDDLWPRGGDPPAGLTVVPHRRLHQVPFHALHDGSRHVLERWAVTVAPTAAVTASPPRRNSDATLVLAVPDAHAPSVAAEAAAIAERIAGSTVLLGEQATSRALAAGVPGPGIVHIACHGLYRSANPMFSSLRMSDRWVTATEILQLDLDNALVTLSACESGKHARGTAEPLGLAWAFLAAGASGAVVSQWVVHDDTTATLMSSLYRHIAGGVQPAEALRRAQLTAAVEHPHPFYWAPFTYVTAPATTHDRSTL